MIPRKLRCNNKITKINELMGQLESIIVWRVVSLSIRDLVWEVLRCGTLALTSNMPIWERNEWAARVFLTRGRHVYWRQLLAQSRLTVEPWSCKLCFAAISRKGLVFLSNLWKVLVCVSRINKVFGEWFEETYKRFINNKWCMSVLHDGEWRAWFKWRSCRGPLSVGCAWFDSNLGHSCLRR